VPLDNAEAAAAAARTLLDRTDMIAGAARETALTRFSARAEAEGIDAVYQSLWQG
jgi:mannosyltransferase